MTSARLRFVVGLLGNYVGLSAVMAWGQSVAPAVFVTNNVSDSVAVFTVQAAGTLSFVGITPTGDGPQTISLSPNGRFIAVGHGTASSTVEELRIFEVQSNATLTPRLTTFVPDSPLDVQWLSDSVLAVTETDLGNSALRTFEFDAALNVLNLIDLEPTGSFNTRLETVRGGSLLYANNSSGANSIYAFSVASTGQLQLIENEPTGSLFAVSLGASHDANFLYGAGGISGDGNRILGFSIGVTGELTPLPGGTYTSPGESPKVVALRGDDSVLVGGHGTDATVRTFLRDSVTGALTATSHLFDVGQQGTLGDLRMMDDLLFVTDSSSSGDGITGIYSFRVQVDGSLTQLGPIQSTFGTRPEYIATWQGPVAGCDFDGDRDCDITDLNLLLAEGPIAPGVPVVPGVNDPFDLNGDGMIDLTDRDLWLADAASQNGLGSPYLIGDANLDGVVDAFDFDLWDANKFTLNTDWDAADLNGDGAVDGSDFSGWNTNKHSSSDGTASLPEPMGFAWAFLLAGAIVGRSAPRTRARSPAGGEVRPGRFLRRALMLGHSSI